ncbi:MAG: phosphatase PAP2 family protein [Patescibacteria group bacterium]|jgi:undecaprenyl-diphosphatase
MLEGSIVQGIQQVFLASSWGEWAAIMLARLWIFLFVPVLAWMWMRDPRDRHAVKEASWSLLVSVFAGELLSLMVMRVRPYLAESNVIALITPPLNSSFPSLHATAAAAITMSMYLWNKNAGHVCLLITFGVIIGRMAVGMHYPTDILAGLAIGSASALLVRLGHNLIRKKSLRKLESKMDQGVI